MSIPNWLNVRRHTFFDFAAFGPAVFAGVGFSMMYVQCSVLSIVCYSPRINLCTTMMTRHSCWAKHLASSSWPHYTRRMYYMKSDKFVCHARRHRRRRRRLFQSTGFSPFLCSVSATTCMIAICWWTSRFLFSQSCACVVGMCVCIHYIYNARILCSMFLFIAWFMFAMNINSHKSSWHWIGKDQNITSAYAVLLHSIHSFVFFSVLPSDFWNFTHFVH